MLVPRAGSPIVYLRSYVPRGNTLNPDIFVTERLIFLRTNTVFKGKWCVERKTSYYLCMSNELLCSHSWNFNKTKEILPVSNFDEFVQFCATLFKILKFQILHVHVKFLLFQARLFFQGSFFGFAYNLQVKIYTYLQTSAKPAQ